MTEQNSNNKALVPAQEEIQSLNFDNLDMTELERRLEMSVEGDFSGINELMDPWVCIGFCQSNVVVIKQ